MKIPTNILILINPNTGKYYKTSKGFIDSGEYSTILGDYCYLPVYPNYTMFSLGSGHMHPSTQLLFKTVVKIPKLLKRYAIEIEFKSEHEIFNDSTLQKSLELFHNHCKEVIKNFNVKNYIEK